VEAIGLTIAASSVSALPRQVMVMQENRRGAILFHVLVPGGT
jgi:hypothetical protein